MIDAALFCLICLLLVLAVRRQESLLLACVLFVVFWIDWQLAGLGGYQFIPWVDGAAIWFLVPLTIRNLKWWSLASTLLSVSVLPVHLWYWIEWSKGEWFPDAYKLAANVLFMLSIAALVIGDTNVRQLIGSCLERLNRLGSWPVAAASSRSVGLEEPKKESSINGRPSSPVCYLRASDHRLGSRVSGRFPDWRVRYVARQEKAP